VRAVAQKKSDCIHTVAVLIVPISWPLESLSDAFVLFVIITMPMPLPIAAIFAFIVMLGLPINEMNGLLFGTCTLSLHKLIACHQNIHYCTFHYHNND